MPNDKKDNEANSENSCELKENSAIIQESSFVTPGIFRRRRLIRQITEDGTNESKEKKDNFKWTIDQIAKICPMKFDETEEFSLPPEDWDPGAEFNRPQFENVDHFWTRNTLIAPSPEVLATGLVILCDGGPAVPIGAVYFWCHKIASRRVQPSFNSPNTSSLRFTLSPLGSGPSCSSKCSLSSSTFMSPLTLLTHSQITEPKKVWIADGENSATLSAVDSGESTNFFKLDIIRMLYMFEAKHQMIADGSEDFEQLERSLSFEVADCIAADMDDGEGFVFMEMRKEGPFVEPIEEGHCL